MLAKVLRDTALWRQAYNSLARHIKNKMVHHPKPTSLAELHKLVQAIDSQYWECKAEITCNSVTTSTCQEAKPESKMDKKTPSAQSKLLGKPTKKLKGAPPKSPKTMPELVNKLGKD